MKTPSAFGRQVYQMRYSPKLAVFVVAGFAIASPNLVWAAAKGKPEDPQTQRGPKNPATSVPPVVTLVPDHARLPDKVAAMREAILAAARSGDIEALRTPLEWNELKPEIAAGAVDDPIAFWKNQSGDGAGRQILAILVSILESQPVSVKSGKEADMYVWPGFAELDLAGLSPAQEVQLYRLVPPAEVKLMREKKAWIGYRLSIGLDGTWHSFLKPQ
jgi:hypothetical protein